MLMLCFIVTNCFSIVNGTMVVNNQTGTTQPIDFVFPANAVLITIPPISEAITLPYKLPNNTSVEFNLTFINSATLIMVGFDSSTLSIDIGMTEEHSIKPKRDVITCKSTNTFKLSNIYYMLYTNQGSAFNVTLDKPLQCYSDSSNAFFKFKIDFQK